jgi:hypothetical protein
VLALRWRELRQRVVRAAELEGADALQVLALEESSAPVSSSAVREVSTGVRCATPARRAAAASMSA